MSRNYDNSQIRRALQPAIEELEQIGFIEACPPEERYRKQNRGSWRVVFQKRSAARPGTTRGTEGPSPPRKQAATGGGHQAPGTAEQARVEAYLAAQAEGRLADIEREALACAPHFLRQNYDSGKGRGGPLFEECRRLMIQRYVVSLIDAGEVDDGLPQGIEPPG